MRVSCPFGPFIVVRCSGPGSRDEPPLYRLVNALLPSFFVYVTNVFIALLLCVALVRLHRVVLLIFTLGNFLAFSFLSTLATILKETWQTCTSEPRFFLPRVANAGIATNESRFFSTENRKCRHRDRTLKRTCGHLYHITAWVTTVTHARCVITMGLDDGIEQYVRPTATPSVRISL